MHAVITWWELDGSPATIESLRAHLRDGGAAAWRDVPGLCLKFWMADQAHNRWGAVMVWESADIPREALPPHQALALIGHPPAHRLAFDIEATVEGLHHLTSLAGHGPALSTLE